MDGWTKKERDSKRRSPNFGQSGQLNERQKKELNGAKNQMAGNHRPATSIMVCSSHISATESRERSGTRVNPMRAEPISTATLFPLMIKSWRDEWKQGDFPFYWVQLADFYAEKPEPDESTWAELRERPKR